MTVETTVVCISRTLAAGGEQVAEIVSEHLGFRYVDDEILQRAAMQAGVTVEQVADAEARRTLLQRVLETLRTAVLTTRDPTEFTLEHVTAFDVALDYGDLLQEAIRETAAEGGVVIVAHAAAAALAGADGVLRLFVTASPETRAARVAAGEGSDDAAATQAVAESDAARRSYFQRFYDFEEQPTVYDLVANTDVLDTRQVADLVVGLVRDGGRAGESR